MNNPAANQSGGAFVAPPSTDIGQMEAALRQSRANLRDALHLTGQLLEAIAEATPDLKDACKFARAEHSRLWGEVRRG